MADWFTRHEHGGFAIWRAALGVYDLSVLYAGGEWRWLVQRDGRDLAEGKAQGDHEARQNAETAAMKLWSNQG